MKNNIFKIRENYIVGKDGNICDKLSNADFQRYTSTNNDVYVLLQIENSARLYPMRIDVLVLSTFTKRPSCFHMPYHIDGNKLNNELSNLKWIYEPEIWLPAYHHIYTFTREYEISSYGNIRERIENGYKNIKQYIQRGYLISRLHTTDGTKNVSLHQIVCATFNNGYTDGKIVNHIDAIKTNNVYYNLEYVTKRENEIHAGLLNLRTGTKVTDSDIITIEKLLREFNGSCKKVNDFINKTNILPNINIFDIKRIKRDKLNPNLFEKLHGDYTDEKHLLIAKILNKTNGRVREACNILQNKYGINISETIVQNVKKRMNIDFPKLCKEPMTHDEISYIEQMLIKFNGSMSQAYSEIIKKYPRITIKDVCTIKMKMKSKGNVFPDGKTNIKITDQQRNKLLQLLKDNNYSPSKTYANIRDNNEFDNVTIYDLKYLKRKYFSS